MTLLFWLWACTGSDPAPEGAPAGPTRVRVALNWFPEPEFGGFYEGVVSGLYAERGFAVELIPGGPGAPTLELLGTGQAEAALTTAEDLLLKRQRGLHAVAVFPAFQQSPTGLLVHDPGPTRVEDIGSGTVAIELGSPFQVFLWKRLGWEGRVQAVPTSGTLGPFLADPGFVQQGYITSEPCVAQAKGAQVRFLKAADVGWNPYGVVLAVPDPPPAWVDDFTRATRAAWEQYLAAPERANAELARLNEQLTPEGVVCITAAQREFVLGQDGLGAMSAARWADVAATLVELGLLPEGSTADGAWRPVPP